MTEKEKRIRPAPASFKASVWQHFGFYEVEGRRELDKSHTVCKLCKEKKIYHGNTTNMRAHIVRWHPELVENTAGSSTTSNQTTIPNTITKLPMHSEKASRITKSIGAFIAKDLRPYSVVENDGFLAMLRTLERR